MKNKLIGSGLALSLLLGGAAFNSTAAKAAPIDEAKNITVESKQNIEPPKEFAAMLGRAAAKGAAWVGGYLAGDRAARAVIGSSSSDAPSYEYEDVKSSFDL
ncbi:hypothetical protein QUG02_28370 [Bacillus hominis]|uniref:Uncharacterized protein n=1 Tax=Bacillus hominis TaxID=2817478 RepID=A0ABT7RG48_9BACI|nr:MULTISPECIES: hypothetical protein [Bacillus cereus group]MDM5191491.1 hypothetical protein [Bacillus hominis]MDM5441917.1 hypothetical protein [Bacillus hominis]OFC88082.1 hypothetical protein BTGOE5_57910 [Bacillus thuringiensis]OFD37048.1 hypothetical protein BWGOE3_55350 [Bacillus mycoides]